MRCSRSVAWLMMECVTRSMLLAGEELAPTVVVVTRAIVVGGGVTGASTFRNVNPPPPSAPAVASDATTLATRKLISGTSPLDDQRLHRSERRSATENLSSPTRVQVVATRQPLASR